MSKTYGITCGLPLCQNPQGTQIRASKIIRLTAIVIGILLILGGALTLWGVFPELAQLSYACGWTILITGIVLITLGISIQCVRNENHSFAGQPAINTSKKRALVDTSAHSRVSSITSVQNYDVNAFDNRGWTRMHHAANQGSIQQIEALLASNAQVDILSQKNDKNGIRQTPLLLAILHNNLTVCTYLLNHGANPDISGKDAFDRERTPMYLAADYGYLECIDLLLKAGADVDPVGPNGNTPLHAAVRIGRADMIKRLLEANADLYRKNDDQRTPFDELVLCRDSPGVCFRPRHTHQWNPQIIDEFIAYANKQKKN